jgi:cytochrome c-type biogenesis protein
VNPIGELVLSGTLLLALPIALLAGFISFASPCVLPLVPGYLAYVGGFAPDPAERERGRLLAGAALFVLGFSLVFVAFNVVFGVAGLMLKPWMGLILRLAGVVLIGMGLVFVGQLSFLQREVKPGWRVATGLGGAPLLGVVFGLGWVPCVGPTLIAVSALSLDSGSPWRAAALGLFYCLGLGIPFLLVALGLNWVTGSVGWLRRHIRIVNIIGGGMLIVIGVLMVSGLWSGLISDLGAVTPGYVSPL